MKRISIGVIAALVLLYPVAAWLMGFVIEKRVAVALDEVREKAPFVSVIEQRFQRGWYSSQQDVTVELFHGLGTAPGAAPAPHPLRMTIHTVLRHGPLCGWTCVGAARAETHIVFSGELQSMIAGVFGSTEPFILRSRLGLFGGGSATISSPAIKDVALNDGGHAGWGGLEADLSDSGGMNSYALHATAPRVMYAATDGKRFEVTATAFETRSQRVLRTLYAGDSALKIGRLAFAGAGGAGTVTVDDVSSVASSSADGGFMTLSSKTSTGAIVTAPVTLTGVHLDFTLRHLEVESLERLNAGMQQINGNQALTQEARMTALLSVLKQHGTALLKQQPEIGIDRVSFANANGAALLQGAVRMRDVTAADFAEGADPKGLIGKIDAELDLTLDEALVQSLPGGANGAKQLQALSEQGLLTHDKGNFHTKIVFRHGQATFNGRPLRPGAAVGPQSGSPPPMPPAVPSR